MTDGKNFETGLVKRGGRYRWITDKGLVLFSLRCDVVDDIDSLIRSDLKLYLKSKTPKEQYQEVLDLLPEVAAGMQYRKLTPPDCPEEHRGHFPLIKSNLIRLLEGKRATARERERVQRRQQASAVAEEAEKQEAEAQKKESEKLKKIYDSLPKEEQEELRAQAVKELKRYHKNLDTFALKEILVEGTIERLLKENGGNYGQKTQSGYTVRDSQK